MSDQGDAGQWRPATSQSERYSAPDDDTTGPLPAVSADEDEAPSFPSVSPSSGSSWSAADDDDAPTGGFPAVPPPEEPPAPQPPARTQRSPFEPADRDEAYEAPSPRSSQPEYPGPKGATPRFGTDVPEAQNESFGSSGGFGSEALEDKPYEPYEPQPYEPTPLEDKPYEPYEPQPYEPTPLEDKPYEPYEPQPYAPTPLEDRSYEPQPYEPSSFEDRPYERHEPSSFDTRPYETHEPKPRKEPEGSWGPGTFPSAASAETGLPPARGVTAEDQAAENDFFASDDHPPMWDKVVAPAGPPPKPGKPSSGNLRLPDWMRDENGGTKGPPAGLTDISEFEDDDKSRRPLYIGLSILVAGLLAAGGVYVLKGNGDSQASNAAAPTQSTQPPSTPQPTQPAQSKPPVRKQLPHFKGVHTKAAGRISDPRAGLSYARLAKPWAPAPRKSPMNELGFSASQFAVTEKAGSQPKHWARLMSAQLAGAAKATYDGPGTEHDAATELGKLYEARMFSFRHKKRVLASQPLNIGGHKGWLVSDYVTYHRPGLKATGDVVTVALVDTGKKTPGVLFMSVPNTTKKLYPDINFVVRSLRVS